MRLGVLIALAVMPAALCDTDPMQVEALKYLGALCNGLTAVGCNPYQMPLYSGEAYLPSVLVAINASDIVTDHIESRSSSSSVTVSTSAVSLADTKSLEFGIQATEPVEGVFLTESAKYHQVKKTMDSFESHHYYGEVFEQYIVGHGALKGGVDLSTKLLTDFKQVVDALPDGADSNADFSKYVEFFERYGTHYVKAITFGGRMKLTTFVSSDIQSSNSSLSADLDTSMQATFAKMAGTSFSIKPGHQTDSYNNFDEYTKDVRFFSYGGDQTQQKFADWTPTVKSNPAPVLTTLGSIRDLLPSTKSLDAALEKYVKACPNTQNGICNGWGVCNTNTHTCTCGLGSYMESDGLCYPRCGETMCGQDTGNGRCTMGKCKCNVDTNGFGYMGDDCASRCGMKKYSAGEGTALGTPGAPPSHPEALSNSDEDMDCLCQKMSGKTAGMRAITHVDSGLWFFETYSCANFRNRVCHHPVLQSCTGLTSVTCQYGNAHTCDSDANIVEGLLVNNSNVPCQTISEILV